jgi:hypothetical protein
MLFGNNNTIITYSRGIATGVDPITGDPVYADIESASWELSLEQKDTKGNVAPNTGINNVQIYLEGRALTIPEWYKPGGYYQIRYTPNPGASWSGKFYAMPTVSSRFGLESVFGQAVNGVLVSDGTNS